MEKVNDPNISKNDAEENIKNYKNSKVTKRSHAEEAEFNEIYEMIDPIVKNLAKKFDIDGLEIGTTMAGSQ
jgi:hypothetical protein